MTEKETVSDVWKDGKNVQGNVKLDLVAHLKNANEKPEAIAIKQKAVGLCDFDRFENPTILDVGCGIGSDIIRISELLELSSKSGSITGIDFNSEMIAAAKEITAKEITYDQVSVSIQQMDAKKLDFENNLFDIIFISCTLQHISVPDVEIVLSEVNRVLKPNGKLVIVEPEQSALKFYSQNEELKSLVEKLFTGLQMANSSAGSGLYWMLPKRGFTIEAVESFSTISLDLTSSDPGWIKLNGMASMAVRKNIITQEECDKFIPLYITAAKGKELMCSSLVFMYKARKADS